MTALLGGVREISPFSSIRAGLVDPELWPLRGSPSFPDFLTARYMAFGRIHFSSSPPKSPGTSISVYHCFRAGRGGT